MLKRLDREFFSRSSLEVAPDLIGTRLVTKINNQITSVRIVETEAYPGEDAASHTFGKLKPTSRTQIQYGEGGFLYMYLIMGLHTMTSVVTGKADIPDVVFVRSAEPMEGIEVMKERRSYSGTVLRKLTAGPGILSQSLGLTRFENGIDVCKSKSTVQFFQDENDRPQISTGTRINLGVKGTDEVSAEESRNKLWRYYDSESNFLSRP